jgi:D-alanyl-D-alanine carboxypeptidase
MLRLRLERSRRARAAFALIATLVVAALLAAPAEARPRKRAPAQGWHTGYSAIVVDAKTGKVLHETKADAVRHPASLTKVMTLYLLFEQIEAGKLKLDSKLKVSAGAAAQAPSKLGLDEDDTIAVEDAIKALVTRSANDVAVAIAEAIGGSEENFAHLMTKKALALGMQRTTFKNASGLPDAEQVTTARDFAILGRAIQDRFPRQYRYFAIKSFEWQGIGIRNHNKLLGKIDGLDGIKTGYTKASGFNLVSSVRVNQRHVVAVILGGNTAAARDARMRELIRANLARASTGARTAPRVVEAPEATPVRPVRIASNVPVEIPPTSATAPSPGSEEPIRPTPVKTFVVGKSGEPASPGTAKPGTLGVVPSTSLSLMTPAGAVVQQWQVGPQPAAERQALVAPAAPAPAPAPAETPAPAAPATSTIVSPPALPSTPVSATPIPASAPPSAPPAPTIPTSAPANVRGGWLIQVGAFPDERQARERLDATRGKLSALLAKAAPYTEKTVKGSSTFFRARFAGLDEAGARRACELLKKSEIACMATKN